MKKIFVSLCMAAICLCTCFEARAYSAEMAQIAEMLKQQVTPDSGITGVDYDGENLVLILDIEALGPDAATLESLSDDEIGENALPYIKDAMGSEVAGLFGQLLSATNSGLNIVLPFRSGKKIVHYTAGDFL